MSLVHTYVGVFALLFLSFTHFKLFMVCNDLYSCQCTGGGVVGLTAVLLLAAPEVQSGAASGSLVVILTTVCSECEA